MIVKIVSVQMVLLGHSLVMKMGTAGFLVTAVMRSLAVLARRSSAPVMVAESASEHAAITDSIGANVSVKKVEEMTSPAKPTTTAKRVRSVGKIDACLEMERATQALLHVRRMRTVLVRTVGLKPASVQTPNGAATDAYRLAKPTQTAQVADG